jgi:hypothetical protein
MGRSRARLYRDPRRRLWRIAAGGTGRGRPGQRLLFVTAALIGLALAIVACGSTKAGTASPSSTRPVGSPNGRATTSSQTMNSPSAVGFSHCMRSHRVPNFPDPTGNGALPKVSPPQLGVSSSEFNVAERACQDLLPAGTDDVFPSGEVQQLLTGMLRFSRCMRSDGVPNWPDPTTDPEGRPEFPLSNVPGTDRSYWHSPRVTHEVEQCQHLLPPALGGTPIG